MSQSILDPAALRDFARSLHNHSQRIQERTAAAKTEIKNLSMFWQDARYREFVEVFETAMNDLDIFLAAAQKQKIYMEQKAHLADRYLRKS